MGLLVGAALVSGAALPGAARAQNEKKRSGGVSFLAFPSLTATVMGADGGRGVLSVEAGLDVPDPVLRRRAQDSLPRLRDAWTRVLSAYAPTLGPGAPPDVEFIARGLQLATDRVLGRSGAKLLLGTVLVN